jgi:hypothetical protein
VAPVERLEAAGAPVAGKGVMAFADDPRRPHWHAELVRLDGELRRAATEIGRAQRAGQPRQVAGLQREQARLRRRIAHLRELLGLPGPREQG